MTYQVLILSQPENWEPNLCGVPLGHQTTTSVIVLLWLPLVPITAPMSIISD